MFDAHAAAKATSAAALKVARLPEKVNMLHLLQHMLHKQCDAASGHGVAKDLGAIDGPWMVATSLFKRCLPRKSIQELDVYASKTLLDCSSSCDLTQLASLIQNHPLGSFMMHLTVLLPGHYLTD